MVTHDPLCDWRPCTCPLDYDVPERGHMIGCPEDDCECEIIAKVRADTLSRAVKRVEKVPFIKPEYADWFTHIAGARPDMVRKDVLAALRGEL